jgi:hypothetical protein
VVGVGRGGEEREMLWDRMIARIMGHIQNCHNDSPLYSKYILIKKKNNGLNYVGIFQSL